MLPNPHSVSIVLQIGYFLFLSLLCLFGKCIPANGATHANPNVRTSDRLIFPAYSLTDSSSPVTHNRAMTAAENSDIIPDDRLYDWRSYCGVPGGIPNRTSVYRTLGPGATAAQISTAISKCPPGQVVMLSAGTYNPGIIAIVAANQVTLRGAGAGQTIIDRGDLRISGGPIGANADAWATYREIASGYGKDSTAITLSSTPPAAFAVGSIICITQNDDYALVWHREGNWAGTKNLRFVSRITSVNGNVIGLATPIPYSYSASQNPICTAAVTGVRLFGIEDMTISGGSITIEGADRCWVKNVEVTDFSGYGIMLQYANTQCEIRRCYIHDVAGFPSSDGYFIQLQYNNSCHRIEDNIAFRTAHLLMNGSSANFVGYNFAYDQRRTAHEWVEVSFGSNHGPHSIMNLWEGNIGQRYQNDGYHGSASHQTLFRNNFHGVSAVGYAQERQLVDLVRGSYYESVVGNVLGAPSWTPNYYQADGSAAHAYGYVYVLGWGSPDSAASTVATTWTNWAGALPDPKVEATLFRHANYDYYNKTTLYQSGVSQTLPPSLCYTSKPSYFGSLQWPPIGPDVTGLVTRIPAQARWTAYQNSRKIKDLFS